MKFTVQTVKALKYTLAPQTPEGGGKPFYPQQIFWDDSFPGFGVRVFPTGKKSYIQKYRNAQGKQHINTVGAVHEIPLDAARTKARRHALEINDGVDPLEEKSKARKGQMVSDLCDAFILRHAKVNKKSWVEDERRNKLYILPALGNKQIQQLKRADIAKLHDAIGRVQGKPYMANRVREQLSKMFELAKTWGYVDEAFINPAKGIEDFQERERDSYVKPEDMPILSAAIDREVNVIARCAIRLYLLTGKRKNELLTAKWSDVDEKNKTLKIADTKNNEVEYLSLGNDAWKILKQVAAFRVTGNPYIFPGDGANGHFVNIRKCWERIKADAVEAGAHSVKDVPIHGLRHTFAVWLVSSGGADLGLIRKLLNQKSLLATKVYAKHMQSASREALERQGEMLKQFSTPPKKTKAGTK